MMTLSGAFDLPRLPEDEANLPGGRIYEWLPGRTAWNDVMAGGAYFSSTGALEPWEMMNKKNPVGNFAGFQLCNYFENKIPACPEQKFAGSEEFYEG